MRIAFFSVGLAIHALTNFDIVLTPRLVGGLRPLVG